MNKIICVSVNIITVQNNELYVLYIYSIIECMELPMLNFFLNIHNIKRLYIYIYIYISL